MFCNFVKLIFYYCYNLPFCYCCSVTKFCPTLCKPMNCSMPGFRVLHYFLEFTQIHITELVSYLNISSPAALLLMKYICICRCIFVCLWYYIYIWLIAIKTYSSTNCFYLLPVFLLRCSFSYWFKKLFYIYINIYLFRN